jgi:hypothetical protein
MSLKLKMLAGLAALALAGGGAALAVPGADAATARCGTYCVTMASEAFGSQHLIAAGSPSSLQAPGFNRNEDFVGAALGTASNLAQINQVPASLAAIYGNEVVYEFAFQPHGVIPTQCLGASGTSVVLQSCGVPTTLWIGVHRHQNGFFAPFVNVGESGTSVQVLTATSATGPLAVSPLSIDSSGTVASTQMWEGVYGIFGQTVLWPVPGGDAPFLER